MGLKELSQGVKKVEEEAAKSGIQDKYIEIVEELESRVD